MKVVHRFLRSMSGASSRLDMLIPALKESIVVKTLELRFEVNNSTTPQFTVHILDASSGKLIARWDYGDESLFPYDREILQFLTNSDNISEVRVDNANNRYEVKLHFPFAMFYDRGTSKPYLETGIILNQDFVIRVDVVSGVISSLNAFAHGVFHSTYTITPYVAKEELVTVGAGGRVKFVIPENTLFIKSFSDDPSDDKIQVAIYDDQILLTDLINFRSIKYIAWDISDALKHAEIHTITPLQPNKTYKLVVYHLKQLETLPYSDKAIKSPEVRPIQISELNIDEVGRETL